MWPSCTCPLRDYMRQVIVRYFTKKSSCALWLEIASALRYYRTYLHRLDFIGDKYTWQATLFHAASLSVKLQSPKRTVPSGEFHDKHKVVCRLSLHTPGIAFVSSVQECCCDCRWSRTCCAATDSSISPISPTQYHGDLGAKANIRAVFSIRLMTVPLSHAVVRGQN